MIWFTLALFVVSFVAVAILAPKPDFEDARPSTLKDIDVPRATENAPVPLILGRVEMDAPNTIWYGHFKTKKIKEKFKTGPFSSETVTVGHKYYLGLHLALGLGPRTTLRKVLIDDKVVWEGTTSETTRSRIVISKGGLFGGHKEGGGWNSEGWFYPGSNELANQPQDGYIQARNPDVTVPAYLGISHIVFEQAYIGESAQLRKMSFILENYPNKLGLSNNGRIGDFDLNPAECLYAVMTDNWTGLGVNPADIDLVQLTEIGEVLYEEGNGMSIVITSESDGEKIITEILRQIDGVSYQDPETGKISFRLIRDDYDVNNLPIYDEDDIVTVRNFSRSGWDEVIAQVKVTFPAREKDSDRVAISQDMATAGMLGRLRTSTVNFPFCYDPDLANFLAARERSQLAVPLFRVTMEFNRNASQLRPGDVFKMNWADYGFDELVMRVQEFDFGELLNGKIVVNAIQDIFAVATPVNLAPAESSWEAVEYLAQTPSNIEVIELPYWYLSLVYGDAFAERGDDILVLAMPSQEISTSYSVFKSTEDGGVNTDNIVTNSPEEATYLGSGTIAADYDRLEGFDNGYDALTGIVVNHGFTTFTEEETADLYELGLEKIIYANGEFMRYATATRDEVNGTTTLTGIRRGLFGTRPRNHLALTDIYEVNFSMIPDGSLSSEFTSYFVYFKVLDRAGPYTQDLDTIPQSQFLIQNQLWNRPTRPRYVEMGGSRSVQTIDNSIQRTVTWRESNRNEFEFENDPAGNDPVDLQYRVQVYIGGALRWSTIVSGPTVVVDFPSIAAPTTPEDGEIRVYADYDGGATDPDGISIDYAFLPFVWTN